MQEGRKFDSFVMHPQPRTNALPPPAAPWGSVDSFAAVNKQHGNVCTLHCTIPSCPASHNQCTQHPHVRVIPCLPSTTSTATLARSLPLPLTIPSCPASHSQCTQHPHARVIPCLPSTTSTATLARSLHLPLSIPSCPASHSQYPSPMHCTMAHLWCDALTFNNNQHSSICTLPLTNPLHTHTHCNRFSTPTCCVMPSLPSITSTATFARFIALKARSTEMGSAPSLESATCVP